MDAEIKVGRWCASLVFDFSNLKVECETVVRMQHEAIVVENLHGPSSALWRVAFEEWSDKSYRIKEWDWFGAVYTSWEPPPLLPLPTWVQAQERVGEYTWMGSKNSCVYGNDKTNVQKHQIKKTWLVWGAQHPVGVQYVVISSNMVVQTRDASTNANAKPGLHGVFRGPWIYNKSRIKHWPLLTYLTTHTLVLKCQLVHIWPQFALVPVVSTSSRGIREWTSKITKAHTEISWQRYSCL